MTHHNTPPEFPSRQQLTPGPMPVEAFAALHEVVVWHGAELASSVNAIIEQLSAAGPVVDLLPLVERLAAAEVLLDHIDDSIDALAGIITRQTIVNACAALLNVTAGANKEITAAKRTAAIARLVAEAGL